MQFNWTRPHEGIYVCNDGKGQVNAEPSGVFTARIYEGGNKVAEAPFSTLALAKQAVQIQLERQALSEEAPPKP